jgi:hypothetical protein
MHIHTPVLIATDSGPHLVRRCGYGFRRSLRASTRVRQRSADIRCPSGVAMDSNAPHTSFECLDDVCRQLGIGVVRG